MPFTKAFVLRYSVPPVTASYHLIAIPVAAKLDTVGEVPEQKDCAAVPVGAPGVVLTVAVEAVAIVAVHPPALV